MGPRARPTGCDPPVSHGRPNRASLRFGSMAAACGVEVPPGRFYARRFGSPPVIALRPENPLIVQSDRTLLLEVAHPAFETVRDELARFAELVKSPEHIHTFRITPLSLWNASASGVCCAEMLATLERWSKYPVPQNLMQEIEDHGTRYGKLRLVRKG